jgi:hypothetical protein
LRPDAGVRQREVWFFAHAVLEEQKTMNADPNIQHLRLVMQANLLNDQTNAIMLAAKLLQEYRALNADLLAHSDFLLKALDAKNTQPDGATVSGQAPSSTRPNLD